MNSLTLCRATTLSLGLAPRNRLEYTRALGVGDGPYSFRRARSAAVSLINGVSFGAPKREFPSVCAVWSLRTGH